MSLNTMSANILSRHILAYQRIASVSLLGARYLYTPEALGMDSYLQVRERIKTQFSEIGDRFRTKMKDFVSPQSVNMVFTEDLKHMLHLADATEEDLELIEEMMVKFNKQNRDLRFGNFIFGPVVMRMYHHLNKPKEALQAFLHPDLDQFFSQVVTFQILMDLLLTNEMYDEVLQVMDIVKDKQLPNARFPRNVVVLATAAAYKKNTPESLEYMKKLWHELREAGHGPMRRAVTFAAALAINQNAPHIAMELLAEIGRQNYVTVRNLKVSALADLNRPDDALPILRSVLEVDGPQEIKHTFCSEVVDKVMVAINKCDKKDVQQEFQRILDQLKELGHISDTSLENVLFSEIEKMVTFQQPPRDQRLVAARFDNRRRPYFQKTQRPGLHDME